MAVENPTCCPWNSPVRYSSIIFPDPLTSLTHATSLTLSQNRKRKSWKWKQTNKPKRKKNQWKDKKSTCVHTCTHTQNPFCCWPSTPGLGDCLGVWLIYTVVLYWRKIISLYQQVSIAHSFLAERDFASTSPFVGVSANSTNNRVLIQERQEGSPVQHNLVAAAGSNFESLTTDSLFQSHFKHSRIWGKKKVSLWQFQN